MATGESVRNAAGQQRFSRYVRLEWCIVMLAAAVALLLLVRPAAAEPRTIEGYSLEVLVLPGARLAGLAERAGTLLLTDLAAGRILQLSPEGEATAIGPALSFGIDVIGDPTGPYKIAVNGDRLLVAQGWTPANGPASAHDHALLSIATDGQIDILSNDFWNPFDFVVRDEAIYVVDAARNTLEKLTFDGIRTTLHRFARLAHAKSRMSSLSPTEFSDDDTYQVDAVPTGLTITDQRVYVTLFSGFPYLAGGGVLVSIAADSAEAGMRVETDNFNMPVDVAVSERGVRYVLEHGRYSQADGFEPGSGALVAIGLRPGQRTNILTGLTRPVSVRLLSDGRIAVTCLDGTLAIVTPS